jgi:hypothetical protein
VRLLLQHGADVNARMTYDDDDDDAATVHRKDEFAAYPRNATALHMAAASCIEERALAAALLQAGACVDARAGAWGWTPLLLASSYSLSLTLCLLAAGASPLVADAGGECALHKVVACTSKLDRYNDFHWSKAVRRTDAAHVARGRMRRNGRYCNEQEWPFVDEEVDVAPFIAAALLRAAHAPRRSFAPGTHVGAEAVVEAATRHGADAPLTRMLRLAAAGVPLSWRRANAAAFPPAFRASVRTLLLCALRGAFLRQADSFDAVVSRLARLEVWPTFACHVASHGPGGAYPPTDAAARALVEHVSVFDFSAAPH